MIHEITARDLAAQLADPATTPVLVDVREPWEWQLAHIEGSVHLPMNLIPLRMNELPDDRPLVIICHHGVRSYQVALYLQQAGFDQLASLKGGVEAWASDIDPAMAHY